MKVTQSVVIGGGSALRGLGGLGGPVVVAVVAVGVLLAAGVFEALVHVLLMLLAALVAMVAAGAVGRWAWLRHHHAPRPLGGSGGAAGVVVSRDPVLVDGRVCVRCVQETPRVERAAVVVALHPGGAVAALCAAHLAAAHLVMAARTAVAGDERRWAR